jgi:acyl carrier protein
MDDAEVEVRVRQIFADLFGIDPDTLTEMTSADQIAAWDSLQHLNLVASVEEEFGIDITEQEVVEMLTFGLVVDTLRQALERKPPLL